ncbi:hypothetical protein AJ80_08031 [Polytolypa hystricis UAMH7299]|uniref:Uncharacterized protein n=1 Tax=Polytolypa hystricis (strain UAMH7299) TaxID=1447883 RepID=A0A2B7XE74_POLH7|nr:hypothetical protein AJ80_08031 [Polytolypa hystricis UAMH7299]
MQSHRCRKIRRNAIAGLPISPTDTPTGELHRSPTDDGLDPGDTPNRDERCSDRSLELAIYKLARDALTPQRKKVRGVHGTENDDQSLWGKLSACLKDDNEDIIAHENTQEERKAPGTDGQIETPGSVVVRKKRKTRRKKKKTVDTATSDELIEFSPEGSVATAQRDESPARRNRGFTTEEAVEARGLDPQDSFLTTTSNEDSGVITAQSPGEENGISNPPIVTDSLEETRDPLAFVRTVTTPLPTLGTLRRRVVRGIITDLSRVRGLERTHENYTSQSSVQSNKPFSADDYIWHDAPESNTSHQGFWSDKQPVDIQDSVFDTPTPSPRGRRRRDSRASNASVESLGQRCNTAPMSAVQRLEFTEEGIEAIASDTRMECETRVNALKAIALVQRKAIIHKTSKLDQCMTESQEIQKIADEYGEKLAFEESRHEERDCTLQKLKLEMEKLHREMRKKELFIKSAEEDNSRLQRELANSSATLGTATNAKKFIEQQLKNLETEVEQLRGENHRLVEKNNAQSSAIKTYREERRSLKKAVGNSPLRRHNNELVLELEESRKYSAGLHQYIDDLEEEITRLKSPSPADLTFAPTLNDELESSDIEDEDDDKRSGRGREGWEMCRGTQTSSLSESEDDDQSDPSTPPDDIVLIPSDVFDEENSFTRGQVAMKPHCDAIDLSSSPSESGGIRLRVPPLIICALCRGTPSAMKNIRSARSQAECTLMATPAYDNASTQTETEDMEVSPTRIVGVGSQLDSTKPIEREDIAVSTQTDDLAKVEACTQTLSPSWNWSEASTPTNEEESVDASMQTKSPQHLKTSMPTMPTMPAEVTSVSTQTELDDNTTPFAEIPEHFTPKMINAEAQTDFVKPNKPEDKFWQLMSILGAMFAWALVFLWSHKEDERIWLQANELTRTTLIARRAQSYSQFEWVEKWRYWLIEWMDCDRVLPG